MLQILIPNYTINHCATESSTALDSEGERGNMTRGHYLKISDELECKLLNNYPPINISTIIQGGHGTGKTGNLAVNFSRQGKHREFSKFNFLHRENCGNTGKI